MFSGGRMFESVTLTLFRHTSVSGAALKNNPSVSFSSDQSSHFWIVRHYKKNVFLFLFFFLKRDFKGVTDEAN